MISATPIYDQGALDIFKLALKMVESGDESIPQSLKDYFIKVLVDTKTILQNPDSVSQKFLPESIELAVGLQNTDLVSVIEELDRFEQITPDGAKVFLKNMEVSSVCQNGFSPFAGLIN